VLACSAVSARAHNNPTSSEELAATVRLPPAGQAGMTFALDPPRLTVALLWRVKEGDRAARFTLLKGAETLLEDLADGTRTGVVRGAGLSLAGVSGASAEIEIWADVVQLPAKA